MEYNYRDELITQLKRSGFSTIGYADDIAFLISGTLEAVLCDLMSRAFVLAQERCSRCGLCVSPGKTDLELFVTEIKFKNQAKSHS